MEPTASQEKLYCSTHRRIQLNKDGSCTECRNDDLRSLQKIHKKELERINHCSPYFRSTDRTPESPHRYTHSLVVSNRKPAVGVTNAEEKNQNKKA